MYLKAFGPVYQETSELTAKLPWLCLGQLNAGERGKSPGFLGDIIRLMGHTRDL